MPDPATLAGRVAPDAVVAAELDAVLVDDRAGPAGETLPLEERAVVVAGEEARLLALRRARATASPAAAASSRVARFPWPPSGNATRSSSAGSTVASMYDWSLAGSLAARDQPQPVPLDDPRVVPRPEHVGTGAPGEVDERVEPEAPVAAHARVRRQALRRSPSTNGCTTVGAELARGGRA